MKCFRFYIVFQKDGKIFVVVLLEEIGPFFKGKTGPEKLSRFYIVIEFLFREHRNISK